MVFTRGQFLPSGIVVACVCVCVCLCVNHLLFRAITRDPLKLGSPNLDQRCKRPWLRSLLFCGLIDLDLQGQIQLWKSKFTPFWACPHHNSPPIQARITKFGPEVQNTLVTFPILCMCLYTLTVSQSRLFNSLNMLHVYWSGQPRVFRR